MPFRPIVAVRPLFKPCKPKPSFLTISRATLNVVGVSFDLKSWAFYVVLIFTLFIATNKIFYCENITWHDSIEDSPSPLRMDWQWSLQSHRHLKTTVTLLFFNWNKKQFKLDFISPLHISISFFCLCFFWLQTGLNWSKSITNFQN